MGGFVSNLGHGAAGVLGDTAKLVGGVFDQFSDQAIEARDRARQQKNILSDQEFAAGMEALKNTAVNLQRAKDAGDVAGVQKYSQLYSYEEQSLGKLMKGDKSLGEMFEQFGGALKRHLSSPSKRPQSVGQQALPPPGASPQARMAAQTGYVNSPAGMPDPQILAAAAGATPEQARQQDYQSSLRSIDEGVKLGYWSESEAKDLRREAYLKNVLGLTGTAVTGGASAGKTTDVQLLMKDGTRIGAVRTADGKFKDFAGRSIDGDLIKRVEGKPSTARPTVIASDVTDLKKAKQLQAAGRKFYDAESDPDDPKELDLDKIPAGMVLQAVELPGGITRYRPRSINDKTVTVGGVVYAISPLEVQQLPQGVGTTLGPQKTGTSRIAPATIQDKNGNFIQLPGTTTPATPGVTGRPTPGARALPAPTQPAKPAATQPAATPVGRAMPGVPAGQVNAIQQRATPVRIATTQIFGDPANPTLKGLADYADLANDKESAKRIGTAVRLARSAMLDAEKQGGHVGATMGPVDVGTGGLGQWATTAMGIPVKLTESQNNAMQDALRKMNPREREAFNAIMATYGTVAGLRALTKAGVAQANMANIEQEIPLIGFNTTSKADFVDKLKRLGEEIQQGAIGVPPSLLDVSQVQRKISQLSGETGDSKDLSGVSTEDLLKQLGK